jgi:hypothetical protein
MRYELIGIGRFFSSRLVVGQMCAAVFNSDWYRARVLELGENRLLVQYIDW